MRIIVALVLLAGVGYFGYMHFVGSQNGDAYQAYETFADKLDDARYEEAADMLTADSAARETIELRRAWQRLYNLKVTQTARTFADKPPSDGNPRAEFKVSQTTYTVPGMTPPALPDFLIAQHAVLVRDGRTWRVAAFTENITSLGRN